MRSVAMKEIVVVALTGCPKYFLSFRKNSGNTQGTTHLALQLLPLSEYTVLKIV